MAEISAPQTLNTYKDHGPDIRPAQIIETAVAAAVPLPATVGCALI